MEIYFIMSAIAIGALVAAIYYQGECDYMRKRYRDMLRWRQERGHCL
jgi:hypothetical protein